MTAIGKLLVLAGIVLASCSVAAPPIKGVVLEEGTALPLPGAIVVARWMHYGSAGLVDSRTTCRHVETATSDAQGRFELAGHSTFALFGDTVIYFTLYRAGLEQALRIDAHGNVLADSPPPPAEQKMVMRPFRGTRGERLEYLSRMSSVVSCPSTGTSEKSLLPLRQALLSEVRQLATTKSEQDLVEGFLFQVEAIEHGYEAAERRQVERLRSKK